MPAAVSNCLNRSSTSSTRATEKIAPASSRCQKCFLIVRNMPLRYGPNIIMDKACYKDMLEAAEESKEEFLIGFVKHQIDLLNLKVFARLREMGKAWSFFRKVYLPDGNISENFYIESWEESYAQVAEKLVPYGYGLSAVMAEGGVQIKEKGSFTLYEKMLEDSLMEYNKKAKYLSFGLVPIAGYWIGKEVELDNIRIILMGMLAGESPENIEERLREPYV